MSNTVASSVASERWVETTLGELAEYITSGSRDWSKYYADSGAIFIRTQDINRNRLSLSEVAFVKLPEKVEGKRSLVRKGDLLVTITGANVGKVAVVEGKIPEAYVSQSVCLVRLKDPSLAKFVHLQLTAKRGDKTTVEAMAYGLGRPVLNLENIRSAPIRVAPPKAQVLMVAEIEKQFSRLDEAVANLKRVKANLKRYKASVLKAAVEGKLTEDWRKHHPNVEPASKLLERILAERRAKWRGKGSYKEPAVLDTSHLASLPKEWTWAGLEQLTSAVRVICYGILMPKENIPNGVLYVKVKDLKGDRVNLASLHRTSPKIAAAFARASLKGGDLLLAIRGTYGRVAEVPPELDGGNITQDTARLDVTPFADHRYVAAHLRSEVSQAFYRRVARGVAVKGVNIGDVRLTPIALPPVTEQKQIVAEVERRLSIIEELEAALEANLARAARLRQAVLRKAFSG